MTATRKYNINSIVLLSAISFLVSGIGITAIFFCSGKYEHSDVFDACFSASWIYLLVSILLVMSIIVICVIRKMPYTSLTILLAINMFIFLAYLYVPGVCMCGHVILSHSTLSLIAIPEFLIKTILVTLCVLIAQKSKRNKV